MALEKSVYQVYSVYVTKKEHDWTEGLQVRSTWFSQCHLAEPLLQLRNPQHTPLWPGTQRVHFLSVATFQCRSTRRFSAVF